MLALAHLSHATSSSPLTRFSYTWGTDCQHGFHGVYLGDLERLQDIQLKRDATNRNWQRVILYNIAKSLCGDSWGGNAPVISTSADGDDKKKEGQNAPMTKKFAGVPQLPSPMQSQKITFETRQLWWQIHHKMQEAEYGNMLLLVRMKDELEHRMYQRKQKYITFADYEELVNKLHLDAEGHVVEPFVQISDREDREAQQRMYYESLSQELEEECLIK